VGVKAAQKNRLERKLEKRREISEPLPMLAKAKRIKPLKTGADTLSWAEIASGSLGSSDYFFGGTTCAE
jgi:hypothetical protein